MKRYFAFLIVLLSVVCQATGTTITTTQPIRDPRGGRLNGKIVFYLPAPAVDTTNHSPITPVAPPVIVNNGLLVGTVTLVGNDSMSPKMYYSANYYDLSGKWLSTYRYYVSGTTFDLGSAPMTPVTTSNISQQDWIVNNLTVGGLFQISSNFTSTGNIIMCSTCNIEWGSSGINTPDIFFSHATSQPVLDLGSSSGASDGTLNLANVNLSPGGLLTFAKTGLPPNLADTGLSRDAAGVIDVGSGTQGSKTGKVNLTTLGFAGGGTVSDDGASGINLFGGGGTGWELISTGRLFGSPGKDINFGGGTSGFTSILAQAVASGTLTLPAATDTLVGKATTDTLTNKTLTNPVINGTPTGTGLPTLTSKKGSGSGSNYSTASTTYAVMDSTNLCLTVTIPTGWKLDVTGIAEMESLVAAVNVFLAISDNAACGTANAGILYEQLTAPSTTATSTSAVVGAIINGDGAVHNVALQYKTTNGADSAVAVNATATRTPLMKFNLSPSN